MASPLPTFYVRTLFDHVSFRITLYLVPNGGMTLGAFLTLFASRRLLAEFRRPIVAHERDDTVIADAAFMCRVCRHLGARFHDFMITQSHSAALRIQRFFLTFMARNHSLSILGGDFLSSSSGTLGQRLCGTSASISVLYHA